MTWQRRTITSLVGRPSNGRWVDQDTDSGPYRTPHFVGKFGLLFESFRGPHPTLVVLGDAQTHGSAGSRDDSDSSRVRDDGLMRKAIKRKENGTNRRLPSTIITAVPDPVRLTRFSGVHALVRMLRTCHVGAVLTKRLVFGAFLGVAGRHVARDGSDLAQLWALLLTSSTFLLWLVIGKPYVSRAVQGVETLAALLELLTLSLALLSGQEELKISQVYGLEVGSSSSKVEAFGTAMLVFQLLAIVAQTGYQWWAVLVELKARWAIWARERQTKGESQKEVTGSVTDRNGARDQTGGKRSAKGGTKKRATAEVKKDGRNRRERKPIRRAQTGGDGQDGTSEEERRRREDESGEGTEREANAKFPRAVGGRGGRKASKVLTSPNPRRTGTSDGDLRSGALKRRVSRSENVGQKKTSQGERDAFPPVRSRAHLDGIYGQETRGRNGACLSEKLATAGDSGGAYWEDARIRDWAGQLIATPVAGRHDTESLVRFGGVKWFVSGDRESEDPSGVLGGQKHVKRNGTESKASGSEYADALVSGHGNSISRVGGGQNNKLLRLKSRREERGASSLTVFLVSEDESEEREGAGGMSEESLQVVLRQTTVASFKFEDA
jgi:hypothetical protein